MNVNPKVFELAKTEFKKVNDSFDQNIFSVKMTYNFYKQSGDLKPDEIKQGMFCKNGETSYSNINGIESVRTKNSTISIQQEDKILVISNSVNKNSSSAVSLTPDSLLRFCSSILRTEVSTDLIKYELVFNNKVDLEFSKMDVIIDKKTFMLSKIVMYYPELEFPSEENPDQMETLNPKMEVIYKNYKNIIDVNSALFLEANYVELVSPKKYKGVGKYSQYKIYNQKIK